MEGREEGETSQCDREKKKKFVFSMWRCFSKSSSASSRLILYKFYTLFSSTVNLSAEWGGISLPAPFAPYAKSAFWGRGGRG